MEEEKNLGEKIAYQEAMIKATLDRLDWENEYKLGIDRSKNKNRSRFRVFFTLMCIVGAILFGFLIFLVPFYIGKNSPDMFNAIFLVAGSVLVPFLSIGFIVCAVFAIHYGKRRNKEMDDRDGKWRTYEEMHKSAVESVEKLLISQAEHSAELAVLNQIREDKINKIYLGNENLIEDKVIQASELETLEKPVIEEKVEGNPLSFALGIDKKDVKILTLGEKYEDFFVGLQQEYLPDTDTEVLKRNMKDYGQTYLVALYKDEPIGICYGWKGKETGFEEAPYAIQGIAIRAERQGYGIGSILLSELENRVSAMGFDRIEVGSAPGYVEHFYIKNGYSPLVYKYDDGGDQLKEIPLTSEGDYGRITRRKGGFVVFAKSLKRRRR